jgi:hypothetical protein
MDFSELPCRGPKLTLLGSAPSWVSSLVFKAFLDLVVLGMLVEPRQHLPRCRRHIRSLIILPGELPDRISGVKPHGRNELYLLTVQRPAKELDTLVSGNVLLSVLRRCPSVPNPSDQAILLSV